MDTNDQSMQNMLSEDMKLSAIKWMAEQVPGGFFVYVDDDSQRLIYANNVCLRLFGCETMEQFTALSGNSFRGIVHPDDYEAVQASIEKQIADPGNNNLDYVEYRIIRKDGAIRWVDDYGHLAHLSGYPHLG